MSDRPFLNDLRDELLAAEPVAERRKQRERTLGTAALAVAAAASVVALLTVGTQHQRVETAAAPDTASTVLDGPPLAMGEHSSTRLSITRSTVPDGVVPGGIYWSGSSYWMTERHGSALWESGDGLAWDPLDLGLGNFRVEGVTTNDGAAVIWGGPLAEPGPALITNGEPPTFDYYVRRGSDPAWLPIGQATGDPISVAVLDDVVLLATISAFQQGLAPQPTPYRSESGEPLRLAHSVEVPPGGFWKVVTTNTRFVAVIDDVDPWVGPRQTDPSPPMAGTYTSADGVTFEPGAPVPRLPDMVTSRDTVIATNPLSASKLLRSDNGGHTWAPALPDYLITDLPVEGGPAGFVAVADLATEDGGVGSPTLVFSPDGRNWAWATTAVGEVVTGAVGTAGFVVGTGYKDQNSIVDVYVGVVADASPSQRVIGSIEVDSVDIDWVLVRGVDRQSLRLGPGLYPGLSEPGGQGTVAIAGHRTTYGSPFADLDQLNIGDQITITTLEGSFTYAVISQPNGAAYRIVDPDDLTILKTDGTRSLLTLTTEHPEFSSRQRLVVHAELVNP